MASLDRGRWEPVLLHHPEPGIRRLVDEAARLGIRTHRRAPAGREPDRRRDPALARAPRRAAGDLPRPPELAVRLQERRARGLACARAGDRRHGAALPRAGRRAPPTPGAGAVPAAHRRLRGSEAPVRGGTTGAAAYARRGAKRDQGPARRARAERCPPYGARRGPARLRRASRRPACIRRRAIRISCSAAAQVPDATFVLAGDGPLSAEARGRGAPPGRCRPLRLPRPARRRGRRCSRRPTSSCCRRCSRACRSRCSRPWPPNGRSWPRRSAGPTRPLLRRQSGLLVPPRDPAALASAIRRLQADPPLARRLAAAARARVEREFSSEATARDVMRVYDEVLAEARGGDGG